MSQCGRFGGLLSLSPSPRSCPWRVFGGVLNRTLAGHVHEAETMMMQQQQATTNTATDTPCQKQSPKPKGNKSQTPATYCTSW